MTRFGDILVLAVGIGPVAALGGLMNVAFLRPWQVPEPDRLAIFRARTAVGEAYGEISIAEYRFFRQHARSLLHMAASRSVAVSVDDGSGQQVRLNSVSVSADYFDALLVGMTLGRGFVADEEDYGAPKAVAIISHHLWRTHFDSDPAIIGRTVLFGRQHFVLVGVAPRGFVDADARGGRRTDVRTQPLRSRRLCWRGRHPDARWRRGDMDPGPPGHGCRSRDHTSLGMSCIVQGGNVDHCWLLNTKTLN